MPTDIEAESSRAGGIVASERSLYLATSAVFLIACAVTFYSLQTMSGGMAMPSRWTMSMMWMVMPGQTWLEAALLFVAMWLAMMIAMMLPSAFPTLLLYRRTLAFRGEPRLGLFVFLVSAGYFLVWLLFGVIAYGLGIGIATLAMAFETVSRSIPLGCGAALAVAGVYQLTPWKSACLRHCRSPLTIVARHLPSGRRGALGLGLHHGAFCAACCWALMLIQLALGIMNLAAMVFVAAVIAAEKLWPRGELVARVTGIAAIAAGLATAVQAIR